MPTDNQKGMSKEKTAKRWIKMLPKHWWRSIPFWMEPVFVFFAIATAIIAFASLIAWTLISFSVPISIYSIKTETQKLKNGQYLQVEYPNLVLGVGETAYISLIISGSPTVDGPVEFEISLPPGLILIEPADQALKQVGTITIEKTEDIKISKKIVLGVINSQSIWNIRRIKMQSISIQSSSLLFPENFDIGIETVLWASARGLVNNTINDKSPLILLVTGFLSGAGTLVFQYAKSKRDQAREDRQKKEKEFNDLMQNDFFAAINLFLNLDDAPQTEEDSDFYIVYERLVKQSGWEYKLPTIVLEKLKKKEYFEARQVAGYLHKLCLIFGPKNEYISFESLYDLCNLTLVTNPRSSELKAENVPCLLIAYQRWKELKPFITSLIHDFAHLPKNLPLIFSALQPDIMSDGEVLLRDAQIQKIVDKHLNNIEKNTNEHEAALKINILLNLEFKWRPLWTDKERKISEKIQRWLSVCLEEPGDFDSISPGFEYAELDSKLKRNEYVIRHSAIEQMDGPFPSIVFGYEGAGKTASALLLMAKHQPSVIVNQESVKIFPVYASFDITTDIKEWMVDKISRALIDFIADNPRQFLNAPASQKTAMGRLMLRYSKSLDTLCLNFYGSAVDNSKSDIDQVLEYLSEINIYPADKLTKEEMLNLLSMAHPDAFDQIYFLWDIRSITSPEDVAEMINKIEDLALPLARKNLYLKIFAPFEVKELIRRLPGFIYADDLVWNDTQLSDLIEKRINRFDLLWERDSGDPFKLVLGAIDHSPRQVIRFIINLFEYVDEHLAEPQKINMDIFDKVIVRKERGKI